MTAVTYTFGDVLTGAVLEEIALQGVSMTRTFGAGDLRGTFHLDQTGKSNEDLLAATEEGRSYVICERAGQPVWGGIVWVRTYQSQAKSYQLYCKAFENYPDSRLIRGDFENLNTEQRNIFRNLWTAMMADPNSFRLTLPGSFPSVLLKSLAVKAYDFKTYRQAMDAIANGTDGFDWTIDISNVGGAYVKTLRIGYPTLGTVQPLDLDYPGQILNYWDNGSMAERGTHMYAVGAGEGAGMLTSEVIHTDLLASGFPRYDAVTSYKSVHDTSLLHSLAVQIAARRKPGVPVFTIEVKGDQEPEFGGYGLGDAVRLNFKDPRHVYPVDQIHSVRIAGWEYYPASDEHVEQVRLMFVGNE